MADYIGAERRRSERVHNGIKAWLLGKTLKKRVPLINLSCHGALVKMNLLPEHGTLLNLALDTTGNEAVELMGRVVRTVSVCTMWGFRYFNIGVEFLNVIEEKRKKVEEVIEKIRSKQ